MKRIVLMLLVMLTCLSCNNDEKKINEFSDLYYEILLIREKFPNTATANPQIRKFLADKGFSESKFRTYSMELFRNDPKLFTSVIDSVRMRAERNFIEYGKERQRLLDSSNQNK